MYINKADVTMVVNLLNQTIIDVVSMTERVPYAVNVSQFGAYTAPLTYPPVIYQSSVNSIKVSP